MSADISAETVPPLGVGGGGGMAVDMATGPNGESGGTSSLSLSLISGLSSSWTHFLNCILLTAALVLPYCHYSVVLSPCSLEGPPPVNHVTIFNW